VVTTEDNDIEGRHFESIEEGKMSIESDSIGSKGSFKKGGMRVKSTPPLRDRPLNCANTITATTSDLFTSATPSHACFRVLPLLKQFILTKDDVKKTLMCSTLFFSLVSGSAKSHYYIASKHTRAFIK
jgi:hypothetical protein